MNEWVITRKIGYFDDKVMLWTIDKSYVGKISVFKNNNSKLIKTLISSTDGKITNGELDILLKRLSDNKLYSRYEEDLQFIDFTGYNKAQLSFEWTTKNGIDEYDIVANIDGSSYEYLDIIKDCSVIAVRDACECEVLDLSHCKYLKRIVGISYGYSIIYTNKIIFPCDLDIDISDLMIEGVRRNNASGFEFVGNNKIDMSNSFIKYATIEEKTKELLLLSSFGLDKCNINGTVIIDLDTIPRYIKGLNVGLYSKINHCNIKELKLKINDNFIKYNNVSGIVLENNLYTIYFLDGKVIEEQIEYE